MIQELSHGIEIQFASVRGQPLGQLLHFGYVHITGADVSVLRGVVCIEAFNAGAADRGFRFVGAGGLGNGMGLANLIAFQMPRALCTLNQRQQLSLSQLVHPVRFVHTILAHDCIPIIQGVWYAHRLCELF
ncbi:hypothetical protein D9M71_603680 [compost metagenome]